MDVTDDDGLNLLLGPCRCVETNGVWVDKANAEF